LDYSPAPQSRGGRKLTNAYWRLAAVVLALLVLWACSVVIPRFSHYRQVMAGQSQCLHYTAPANQVVFRHDPANLTGAKVQTFAASALWISFHGLVTGRYWIAVPVLYLHGRRTPSGEKQLICVRAISGDESGLLVERNVVRPGGWGREPVMVRSATDRLSLPSAKSLVVYAGQSDPNDPTHFTIAYSTDGQSGTIDGWVLDQGEIRLELRGP
jgi:hypothetical protein